MIHFLFQADPIGGDRFKPIKIDIHQGVIKIVDEEIHYDYLINNTESVIVGTDRDEVLERIQRGFEYQFKQYDKIEIDDINLWIQILCRHGREYSPFILMTMLMNRIIQSRVKCLRSLRDSGIS